MNEDQARKLRQKKIARLVQQCDVGVRAAIQGSRKDKGLSQDQAAEKMGWTFHVVSNIEVGRREITVAEFIVLARQMGVDPEVLFRRAIRW